MAIVHATQHLSFIDLQYLVDVEGYGIKNSFNGLSAEHVTKTQIIDALYLSGNPPLPTLQDDEHVPYYLVSKLQTVWVGLAYTCEDDVGGTGNNIPGLLSWAGSQPTTVDLVWDTPIETVSGTTVTSYVFEYKLESSSTWISHGTTTGGTTYAVTLGGFTSGNSYTVRMRFNTNNSGYSSYSNTVVWYASAPTNANCGAIIQGGQQPFTQEFVVAMSGSGSSVDFWVEPANITDRFQIWSGGVQIYNSKYIGANNISNNEDLKLPPPDGLGIPDSEVRLGSQSENLVGYETGINDQGFYAYGYGIKGTFPSSLVVNNTVTLLVDAPLTGTAFEAFISCRY